MSLESSPSVSSTQDLAFLLRFKQASELHDGLMTTFLSMVTRSSGSLLLRSMLRQTLESFARLTGAEESSFFWLDARGCVAESILARGVTIREQRDTVVGQVLEKGLAGWVYRRRVMGVISDTARDDRWLELPFQPYVAKSIICFPIIRGSHLLAIATLMHSEVGYFDEEKVQLVELCAARVAMVLDLLRVRVEELEKKESVETAENQHFRLTDVGQLILSDQGRLLFACPKFEKIFDYGDGELKAGYSFLDLVATTHRDSFAQRLAHCFEGNREGLLLNFRGISQREKSLKLEFFGHLAKLGQNVVVVACVREVL